MIRWLINLLGAAKSKPKTLLSAQASAGPEESLPSPFLRRKYMLDLNEQVAAYVLTVETPAAMRRHAWHGAAQKFFDGFLIDQLAGDKMAELLSKRLVFLPLSPVGLELAELERLPRRNLVIEFDPPTWAEMDGEATLARLRALHDSGFRLCCGHGLERRGLAEALHLARYISLDDVANQEPPELLARCRELGSHYPGARLVARNIDSTELYQACRKLGFQLFEGRFLTQSHTRAANKILPSRLFVLKLLNGIRQQVDYDELANIAWCDPALGYRLLRFVNSAAFGLRMKIERLRHAMVYVGRQELYRWVTLLLFNGEEGNRLDDAQRENALARARLVETLAEGRMSRQECDEAFVVGILSVVDALMGMPMPDVLAQLSLPEVMSEALLHRRGRYAPYLKLAIACEEGDQASIEALAAECGLEVDTVNQRHIDALTWSLSFIEALEEAPVGR